MFFNLHISDMPETRSQKFGHADDWVLTRQHRFFEETEAEIDPLRMADQY